MGLAATIERAEAQAQDASKIAAEIVDDPGDVIFAQVLDETGDTRHEWDTGDPAETELASEFFSKMIRKGYDAYRVSNGEPTTKVTTFEPRAGRLIFAKRPVAG
jgi:hypothetical protein